MRWVKLTFPPRLRARKRFMMFRSTSSNFAGTSRTLVAVGTLSDWVMLATIRAGTPRRASGTTAVVGAAPFEAARGDAPTVEAEPFDPLVVGEDASVDVDVTAAEVATGIGVGEAVTSESIARRDEAAEVVVGSAATPDVDSNNGEVVVKTTALVEIRPDEKYAFQLSVTEFGSSSHDDRISSTSHPLGPIACSRITSLTDPRYPALFMKPLLH